MEIAHGTHGLHGSDTIKRAGGWLIGLGVVFVILGIIAIVEPGIAGITVSLLVGWLLIFGGVAHLIATFSGGGLGRVIWNVILGIIYIIGGFYFLTHPLLALGTLTLFLAGILIAEAVLEFIAYFQRRSEEGSGWLLVNGLITLFLGLLIWRHWPSSSIWAIGTIVGVKLLMTGISRLMLGSAARKLANRVAA
jgi:uncharacterized membrane protein HdeD (DUF308 family)